MKNKQGLIRSHELPKRMAWKMTENTRDICSFQNRTHLPVLLLPAVSQNSVHSHKMSHRGWDQVRSQRGNGSCVRHATAVAPHATSSTPFLTNDELLRAGTRTFWYLLISCASFDSTDSMITNCINNRVLCPCVRVKRYLSGRWRKHYNHYGNPEEWPLKFDNEIQSMLNESTALNSSTKSLISSGHQTPLTTNSTCLVVIIIRTW